MFHSFAYPPPLIVPGWSGWIVCMAMRWGLIPNTKSTSGARPRGERRGGERPGWRFCVREVARQNNAKVYEDRVDLKSRLPAVKDMRGTKIYVLIDNNQLYVYLIPDYDWNTKRNHRPANKQPNGPDGYEYLDVKTLYPDNDPPKVRGGRR